MLAWQDIRDQDATLVTNSQQDLLIGSWLLGLLAAASVAVLVGGRMAEHTRRVGLLKAVGGTPGLVAAVLLAENLFLALIAAAAGLAAGRLAAPLLTSPGAGLVGTPGAPSLTVPAVALVATAALAVAMIATLVLPSAPPAPARSARWPARLPVPLLLGLRLAARRPRRAVLSASIAITVTTIVAVLAFRQYAHNAQQGYGLSGLANPQTDRDSQVLLAITVALIVLAAINAIFITWATVLDARRPSALARALGATPPAGHRRAVGGAVAPSVAGRHSRHPAGHRTGRGREQRAGASHPAGLAAAGRGAGDPARGGRTHRHPSPRRRPPPRGRDPSIRTCLIPVRRCPSQGSRRARKQHPVTKLGEHDER
ncbi:MAG TPA: FtsX-like permease family protein [Streptosporangiaceae bacterium]|jgi:putative ABC transport system permease protein